jgi:hypothetical protein
LAKVSLISHRERERWLKGIPAPPGAGRPISSRQKISERLLQDLAAVWEEHGRAVLELPGFFSSEASSKAPSPAADGNP